jgi:signal transduction histidine kinase
MNISTRLFISYALILFLFGIVAFVNQKLSAKIDQNYAWLQHSDEITRKGDALLQLTLTMDNSLRAFLLTDKRDYLDPFLQGEKKEARLFDELYTIVGDVPSQQKLLDTIRQMEREWERDFAEPLISAKLDAIINNKNDEQYYILFNQELKTEYGQHLVNRIRIKFNQFNENEYAIRLARKDRLAVSMNETRRTTIVLMLLAAILSIGAALYMTRIITNRILKMVNLADRISRGNFKIAIEDQNEDEMRHLSDSLNIMARTLDEGFSDLKRKNQELDQFAYVVSHDLKAPLRGIDNVLQWIDEDNEAELSPQVKEYLGLIKGRTKRMENLINGILEFSRVGRGIKPVEMVDVEQLLKEIAGSLSLPDHFRITIEPDMPVFATEKIYLEQVFSNLISNSIKYNDKAEGEVSISHRDTGSYYEFTVKDNGPGIAPEFHEKIFGIFQTLKERDTFESTGVGLAIVKKIIMEKNGTIKVNSKPSAGCAFIFTWPKK